MMDTETNDTLIWPSMPVGIHSIRAFINHCLLVVPFGLSEEEDCGVSSLASSESPGMTSSGLISLNSPALLSSAPVYIDGTCSSRRHLFVSSVAVLFGLSNH